MPRKINDDIINNSIRLLDDGLTLKDVGQIVGFHPDNLSKHIRLRGISTNRSKGRKPHNFLNIDTNSIISAYKSGESELSISKRLGFSRNVIRNRLVSNGIEIRDGSEANFLRFQNYSKEQRHDIVKKAQSVWIKQVKQRTPDIMKKVARARCKRIGLGERYMCETLTENGINYTTKKACGIYNIDITIGTIAVEIARYRIKSGKSKRFGERFKYISDHGYTFIYISFMNMRQLIAQIDNIIRIIKETDSLPPSKRKNLVIRCCSNCSSRFRNNKGQFASIPTPETFFYSISEIDI